MKAKRKMTAKAPKPAASTLKAPTAKKPGVVATILAALDDPKGKTHAELLAILAKKFPERIAEQMSATVHTQAGKNSARREKDEDGKTRFYGRG